VHGSTPAGSPPTPAEVPPVAEMLPLADVSPPPGEVPPAAGMLPLADVSPPPGEALPSAEPPTAEVLPPAEVPSPAEQPPTVEQPLLVQAPVDAEPLVQVEPPVQAESAVHAEPPVPAEPPASAAPAGPAEQPVHAQAPAPVEQPAIAQPPPPARLPPFPGAPVGLGRTTRSGRTRSRVARLSAVLALLAVIAAVVLLLHGHNNKTVPPAAPAAIKVLIPEGKTRMQIAQIATADGLTGSYMVASRHSPVLDPTTYGAPKNTPSLEGFLFPATYDMDPRAPVGRLVEEQLIAFRENFGSSEATRARALHVTPYQLLIVASMVEREAQIPSDRAKIAAVIYNRLAQGMPLGIDASIYYAVELKSGVATYTHELTEAQLHINSPYNTRTHVGLPPTPISNPGLASIEAAAHPAHDAYLYYVAGADGCGEQVFSNTLAEFETNAAAYKAAVARNGGRPPTCKHK
jgi:cell division protein YceG involved in septum cleavage